MCVGSYSLCGRRGCYDQVRQKAEEAMRGITLRQVLELYEKRLKSLGAENLAGAEKDPGKILSGGREDGTVQIAAAP